MPESKASILMVDDLDENLLSLEAILANVDRNLVRASSGEQALRLLLEQDFAVILLDVVMPGMDGFETAALMRQREKSKCTPIVFLTALSKDHEQVRKAYTLGAVDYIIKPIVPEILRAKVEFFLNLREQQRQLRRHAEELQFVNEELQRRTADLDTFAFAASHDLKSPMRAIGNLSKWIIEDAGDDLPEPCYGHLDKMQQRVRRMEKLLMDLLHYSRAGRGQYDAELIATGELVEEIKELISLPESFSITAADNMPTLETARPPLQQVLMNLITNGIKHHDRENGHIEISVRDSGNQFEFAVADDGPGIDPKFHERIFGMFQTLQARDKVEGSGMGLAVIKKAVESYGGIVTVESAVGRGTTFRFTWPKSTASQSDASQTEKRILPPSIETKKELVHVE